MTMTTKDQLKDLGRQEELREVGLAPRTTKQRALDLSKFHATFPNRKGRWVQVDKVDSRDADGWQRVTEADAKKGGVSTTKGSQYVLMWWPRAQVDVYHKAQQHRTRSLLEATKGEFKAEVAAAAEELRAQGANLPSDKSLLSDETDGRGDAA